MGRRTSLRARTAEATREFRRPLVDIQHDGFLQSLFLQRYVAMGALAVGSAVVFVTV